MKKEIVNELIDTLEELFEAYNDRAPNDGWPNSIQIKTKKLIDKAREEMDKDYP